VQQLFKSVKMKECLFCSKPIDSQYIICARCVAYLNEEEEQAITEEYIKTILYDTKKPEQKSDSDGGPRFMNEGRPQG